MSEWGTAVIVGQGYVGLPVAMRAAEVGWDLVGFDVCCADPYVPPSQLPSGCVLVEPTVDEAAAADAVVVLVDHDLFDLDELASASRYTLDCRHVVEGPTVEHL